MKRSLLEDVHCEQPVRVSKSSLPKLSYKKALNSWFASGSGVYQVSRCNVFVFAEMVKCSIETLHQAKRQGCINALKGLDMSEQVDRFFILNELLAAGAKMKLFSSMEEAQDSIAQVTSPQ